MAATRPALSSWLKELGSARTTRIALEASGASAWVTYLLKDAGYDVVAVHPNHVRAIAETKRKSDRLDARRLAELLRAGVLRAVHIPPEEERASRSLVRQRHRLVKTRTRAKNAVTSLLAELGHTCSSSDAFGKRGRQWIASLSLVREHRIVVDQQLEQIDLLLKQITILDAELERVVERNPLHVLVRTIPGVGPALGPVLALEIGDVRRFKTARAAACYSGTIPATFQSGEKCRGGGITKEGNPLLRWALVQTVMQLVRLDAGAKAQYVKLRNRIKRHKARLAMARRLMVTIWHMAKNGEAYRRSPPAVEPSTRKPRAPAHVP